MSSPIDNVGFGIGTTQRHRRRRSRLSVTSDSSSTTNDRREIDLRRTSRARKSLNFNSQPNRASAFRPPFDEQATFPAQPATDQLVYQDEMKSDNQISISTTNSNEAFWSNPPPLPSHSSLPHPGFKFSASSIQQHRRSPRLLHKSFNPSKHNEVANTSLVVSDDSGFEPTPPSSQNYLAGLDPLPSSTSKTSTADSMSITSSDYGTLSEDSIGIGLQSQFNNRMVQSDSHLTLSPGYLSDIDEIVPESPPNSDKFCFDRPSWGDDEEGRTETQPPDVVLVLDESEGLEGILVEDTGMGGGSNSSYLDISNLSNGAKNVGVKWLSDNGVHIVIPMQGIQFPSHSSSASSSTTTYEDSPIPLPSRTRRDRLNNPPQPSSPFTIVINNETCNLQQTFLKYGLRLVGASDTVTLLPIGTKFCTLYPAIVSIPLTQLPAVGDQVYCLKSTRHNGFDLDLDPRIVWTLMTETSTAVEGGRVTFETNEFCSYVIVIREQGIEAQKQIRTRIGGKLIVPEVPWIEIEFPRGSLREDITAKAHVSLDTELSVGDFFETNKIDKNFERSTTLASPIVMLEPHGFDFFPEVVRIDLPVPNYDEIQALFGHKAKLQVWQSCTGRDEPSAWERLDVGLSLRRVKHLGNQIQTVASFTVRHFSFFKVVWDLISASLYEAKVGMSYFHSFVSFSMKCQANMEEAEPTGEGSRFGLEVTCFRSDKRLPEHTNYQYRVGASMKPKLVRPGKIFVRLKSSYFEADVDAGEDPELIKEEADFRGRDFEVQYCCKFKPDKPIDRGPFGKVIVNRQKGKAGKPGEKLFEFNLQKSGHEAEKTPGRTEDRWSIVALQELATGLFILDGDNWKAFAHQIGFTKKEVKTHFKNSDNPFLAMVSMYQHRGGTPDEFVQALYTVNRELRIPGGASPCSSRKSRSSNGSSGRGSLTNSDKYRGVAGIGSDSDTSGTAVSHDSGLAGPSKKRSNPSTTRGPLCSKAKRPRKRSPAGHEGDDESLGRRDNSGSETEEEPKNIGDMAKSETNASSINRRNDATKLNTSFLWIISGHLETSVNWKSLGRTLWLEESVLINIEVAHRLVGMRELFYQVLIQWREKHPKRCTFGILYCALRKEGMNQVAKEMMKVNRND